MLKVYGIQLSDFYPSATLPQAIGTIWSYAYQDTHINKNYFIENVFWQNEQSQEIISNIHDPDVLMCSCYVWNWTRTYEVIKHVKQYYPNCLVVIGGPEPSYDIKWMQEHPEVDILIPYYGEQVFKNVLIENLKDKDFSNVDGIITKDFYNQNFQQPIFEEIPSPYLNGFFDWILTTKSAETKTVRCVFESNRGCPYSCTFCDIGSKHYQKVKVFDFDRVVNELEWIVSNNVRVIDVADANFGILPRDEIIVDKLIELKKKYDWKGRFLPTWSKAKGDRVLQIAKKVVNGGLDSIFGLSLQSLNPQTLKNIKRINAFNLTDLSHIIKDMNADGVKVYTELIFPLPGDTKDNFKNGLYDILDMPTVFNKFQINQLSKYSNAEFSDVEYNNKFKIEWAKIKGFTRHYHGIHSSDTIAIANEGISKEDTFEGLFFSKSILIPFYFYGILTHTADILHSKKIISRSNFIKDIEVNLNKIKWFIDFKEYSKQHYFNAITGKEQFGYNFSSDKLYFYPEFAYSHKMFIENNIHKYLKMWYPDYQDLLTYDENCLWTGKSEEKIISINNETWLFRDEREMLQDNYYDEIYVIGRFDDRWKKETIRRL